MFDVAEIAVEEELLLGVNKSSRAVNKVQVIASEW